MKCRSLGLVALLPFAAHVHAAVHIDVSHDGDISVDMAMEPKSSLRPERGQSSQSIYPSRNAAHVLEDYKVDLEYEIHGGVLSVSERDKLPVGMQT